VKAYLIKYNIYKICLAARGRLRAPGHPRYKYN